MGVQKVVGIESREGSGEGEVGGSRVGEIGFGESDQRREGNGRRGNGADGGEVGGVGDGVFAVVEDGVGKEVVGVHSAEAHRQLIKKLTEERSEQSSDSSKIC